MEALFIDIGSNTIKSMLAKYEDGKIFSLMEKSIPERISADNSLVSNAAEIIGRAVAELRKRALEIVPCCEIVCFGTSALREFPDAKRLLDALSENGINIRVLSGEDEAMLSFQGALTDEALELTETDNIVYADLGGGSMEFVVGSRARADFAKSLPLGAVKLSKKFASDFEETASFCREKLAEIPSPAAPFQMIIAGGAVTAARFILGCGKQSASPILSQTDLKKVLAAVLNETPEELRKKYGTPKNRTDILPAAFTCLIETLKYFGKDEFIHTHHSLRYGVADEFFRR